MTETLTIGKALNLGLRRAMEDDAKVLLMGEDIGKLGGVFRSTDGLQKDFGDDRVVDTPLAEAGILGTAVGLAMPDPAPLSMFDHIYVEEHPLVEAERAEFAAYAASFEGSH